MPVTPSKVSAFLHLDSHQLRFYFSLLRLHSIRQMFLERPKSHKRPRSAKVHWRQSRLPSTAHVSCPYYFSNCFKSIFYLHGPPCLASHQIARRRLNARSSKMLSRMWKQQLKAITQLFLPTDKPELVHFRFASFFRKKQNKQTY